MRTRVEVQLRLKEGCCMEGQSTSALKSNGAIFNAAFMTNLAGNVFQEFALNGSQSRSNWQDF